MKHQPTKAKRRETPERRAITRAGIKRPTDTGETLDHIAAKLAADAGLLRYVLFLAECLDTGCAISRNDCQFGA